MNRRAIGSTSAALFLVVVVLAAALVYTNAMPHQATRTSTSTVTRTSTITVIISSTSAKGATGSRGPVAFYRTNGDWNFSVILNATEVTKGQVIAALLNLTNISGQNQSVHVVAPLYNPTLYSQNGTMVWCSCPPELNFNMNWTYGPGRSQEWDIQTSSLQSGQTYSLNIWPFIDAAAALPKPGVGGLFLIGKDLMINATVVVS